MKSTFDPARKLDLYLRVGMDGSKTFTFTDQNGDQRNISDLTFGMKIYEREGGAVYLNWTEASEISRPDDYSVSITFTDTASQGIRPHQYFYIITRTDGSGLVKTWFNGALIAHEGEFDGVTETTSFQINDAGETISVTINDSFFPQSLYELKANTETELADADTIDISDDNNFLETSRTAITLTISSTSDFIRVYVTLTGTSLAFTLPDDSLCQNSDGTKSGDETCTLSGTSGNIYEVGILKRGVAYSVIAVNISE